MVTLSAIFGDDEHTAAEAPYVRVLRTRKWVLLTAGLLLLGGEGHFLSAGLSKIVPFLSLSGRDVAWAAGLTLIYTTIIYLCLTGQLALGYRRTLRERIWARHDGEIDKFDSQIRAAEANIVRHETMQRTRPDSEEALLAESECARLREEIDRASTRRAATIAEGPSRGFVALEVSIDLARILPAFLVAAYALSRWWFA